MSNPLFPIVGIGASAGALKAFQEFLRATPADSGLAYVLIPHLDPTHESSMAELLAKHTTMPVVEASHDQRVEVNHVYIIPPNHTLTIKDRRLQLGEPLKRSQSAVTIDVFFHSLAEDQNEYAVGIVLTGTGTHGSDGLKAIKTKGGLVLAQDPATAAYDGMPRAAVDSGLMDFVCRIDQMPDLLSSYAKHSHTKKDDRISISETEEVINDILALLLVRSGVDFRHYKHPTLKRRIDRRIGLNRLGNMRDYLALLRDNPDEIDRLGKDLMIGVTSLLRDPAAFDELTKRVLAPLIAEAHAEKTLRVWVPGCSTGEEAYTIAMLLSRQMTLQNKYVPVLIFASDIDDSALDIARAGQYPAASMAALPGDLAKNYFEEIDSGHVTVKKALREMVVFARQNLVADPPFSKMDLISCRNLMIYLKQPVQEKVISLFHFALNSGGWLLLGGSEGVSRQTDLFQPVEKKWGLYRRLDGPTGRRSELAVSVDRCTAGKTSRQPGSGRQNQYPAGGIGRPLGAGRIRARDRHH